MNDSLLRAANDPLTEGERVARLVNDLPRSYSRLVNDVAHTSRSCPQDSQTKTKNERKESTHQ
jgi:hypothetical protein